MVHGTLEIGTHGITGRPYSVHGVWVHDLLAIASDLDEISAAPRRVLGTGLELGELKPTKRDLQKDVARNIYHLRTLA